MDQSRSMRVQKNVLHKPNIFLRIKRRRFAMWQKHVVWTNDSSAICDT